MDVEQMTGLIAVLVTCIFVLGTYPREILLAWQGKSDMSIAFQVAASATFASWVIHAAAAGPNYVVLGPNGAGMLCAIGLTATLVRQRRRVAALNKARQ